MGAKSKIQWTDATWNPIRARNVETGEVGWHCEKVSPGCANCYAESMNRFRGTKRGYTLADRRCGDIELFLDEKTLAAPLRWRKPRRVFVCSMTDLFASFVPDEWIDRVFAVMAIASRHTFQVLTKRSERMCEYLADRRVRGQIEEEIAFSAADWPFEVPAKWSWNDPQVDGHGRVELSGYFDDVSIQWPLPNVWLGASAEDQKRLNERVPDLLATLAAKRFISAEPLLGPLDLSEDAWCSLDYDDPKHKHADCGALDQVIVGGESGPGARPCDVEAVRSIVKQCQEAGVACFVKQLGAKPFTEVTGRTRIKNGEAQAEFIRLRLSDSKGGNPAEWPDDLRVRELPAGEK